MGKHEKPCIYREVWDEYAGYLDVCSVHEHNSQHTVTAYRPNPPCLEMDPWSWMVDYVKERL